MYFLPVDDGSKQQSTDPSGGGILGGCQLFSGMGLGSQATANSMSNPFGASSFGATHIGLPRATISSSVGEGLLRQSALGNFYTVSNNIILLSDLSGQVPMLVSY